MKLKKINFKKETKKKIIEIIKTKSNMKIKLN